MREEYFPRSYVEELRRKEGKFRASNNALREALTSLLPHLDAEGRGIAHEALKVSPKTK